MTDDDIVSVIQKYRGNLDSLPSHVWFNDGEEEAQVFRKEEMAENYEGSKPKFRVKINQLKKEISKNCIEKYI